MKVNITQNFLLLFDDDFLSLKQFVYLYVLVIDTIPED